MHAYTNSTRKNGSVVSVSSYKVTTICTPTRLVSLILRKREEKLKTVVKGMKEQDRANRENIRVLQWHLIGAVEKCKQFLLRIDALERELIAAKRVWWLIV